MNTDLHGQNEPRYNLVHKNSGARVVVGKDIIIGRREGKVRIAKDHALSSKHVQVGLDRDGIWVQDLGSTNGTFLGNQQLAAEKKYRFKVGDVLKIGQQIFCLEQETQKSNRPISRDLVPPSRTEHPKSQSADKPTLVRTVSPAPVTSPQPEEPSVFPALWALTVLYFLLFLKSSYDAGWAADIPPLRSRAFGAFVSNLVTHGEWWRLLTSTFLHGDILHLLSNVVSMWMIGPQALRNFGRTNFFWLIILGGICANLPRLILFPDPKVVGVGASGAMFALFGACVSFILLHWNDAKAKEYKRTLPWLLFFVVSNLGLGIQRVDASAHVGGAIAGLILGAAFIKTRKFSFSSLVPIGALAIAAFAVMIAPKGPRIFVSEVTIQTEIIQSIHDLYIEALKKARHSQRTLTIAELQDVREAVDILRNRITALRPENETDERIKNHLQKSLNHFSTHLDLSINVTTTGDRTLAKEVLRRFKQNIEEWNLALKLQESQQEKSPAEPSESTNLASNTPAIASRNVFAMLNQGAPVLALVRAMVKAHENEARLMDALAAKRISFVQARPQLRAVIEHYKRLTQSMGAIRTQDGDVHAVQSAFLIAFTTKARLLDYLVNNERPNVEALTHLNEESHAQYLQAIQLLERLQQKYVGMDLS